MSAGSPAFSPLQRRLLDEFQRDLPLESRPFARIAEALGVSEQTVLDDLRQLRRAGAISRVGAVLRPGTIGASTHAAMAVPERDLERVAALVNGFAEVNHNYQREHHYNLWFVLTARDRQRLREVIDAIEQDTGIAVLDLPMQEEYFIDLGFQLQWT